MISDLGFRDLGCRDLWFRVLGFGHDFCAHPHNVITLVPVAGILASRIVWRVFQSCHHHFCCMVLMF